MSACYYIHAHKQESMRCPGDTSNTCIYFAIHFATCVMVITQLPALFCCLQAVMLAFLVTAVAVVCLSLFAINTKIDVTRWGTLLLVAMVAFVVLLIVGIFWINKVVYLVIAGFACLLFSAYLIYDIQVSSVTGSTICSGLQFVMYKP